MSLTGHTTLAYFSSISKVVLFTFGKFFLKRKSLYTITRMFMLISTLFLLTPVQAQKDTLEAMIEVRGAFTSSEALPHWLTFNQYGFFNSDNGNGYIRGEVKKSFSKGDFRVDAEIDIIGRPENSFFHEAYINLNWRFLDLQIGKNEVSNNDYPDDLSTGHLWLSRNAPTIPKITVGILEYSNVPWSQGFVQVKGSMSQGRLGSDRVVKRAWYHEKIGYIRSRKLPINIHLGFAHNALFGGELNGEKQSTNFLEVFKGSASSTSNVNGDARNAAGAHFGFIDYGVDLESEKYTIQAYYQQPWTDRSGLKDFSAGNKDYLLGVHLKLKGSKWVSEILYENMNTLHQSGEGLPDPFVNGEGYSFEDLRPLDYEDFLLEELGIVANDLSFEDFVQIIRFETNNNLEYGGRDSYYVNRGYPTGNLHQGFVIGNPLFLTSDRLFAMTGFIARDASALVNNRIQAQHLGIKGLLVPWGVYYKLLVTFTQNYGTYAGKYGGNINSWTLDRNYFLRDGVNAQYLMLDLTKKLKKVPLEWNVSTGFDQRGFGQFFGGIIGLRYTLK